LEWATAIWERGEEEQGSYEGFVALFRGVFDPPREGRQRSERILQLRNDTQTKVE
jgi:hypothetical protein